MIHLRPSRDEDIASITDIYAHHVLHGTGTFETTPPSLEDMCARRADVLSKGLPYLVAERGGEIVGYAYCQWFKPRPAYRFSAEDSIYVRHEQAGQGVGGQLLTQLAQEAQERGVRRLIAVIGDSANTGSIAVHRKAGFTPAGVIHSCGWKFGRWLDIVLMECALGEADRSPPKDPT